MDKRRKRLQGRGCSGLWVEMSKDQASVTSGTRSFPARIRLGLGLLAGHCQDHPGGYWILDTGTGTGTGDEYGAK
jgi:hypothetical protein